MNPKTYAFAIVILGPMAGTITVDLNEFIKARKRNKKATFDWSLFAARAATGFFSGVATAAGVQATGAV